MPNFLRSNSGAIVTDGTNPTTILPQREGRILLWVQNDAPAGGATLACRAPDRGASGGPELDPRQHVTVDGRAAEAGVIGVSSSGNVTVNFYEVWIE